MGAGIDRGQRAGRGRFRIAKYLLSGGMLLGVCWLVLRADGIDGLKARFDGLLVPWVVAAIALHFVSVCLGVIRWRLLLRRERPPLSWMFRTYLVGRFVGAYTPSTVGLDVYRVYALSRITGRKGAGTSAVLVEKFVGLVGLALLTAALVPFGVSVFLDGSAAVVGAIIVAASVAGIAAVQNRAAWNAVVDRLPRGIAQRANGVLDVLCDGRIPRGALILSTVLSALAHLSVSFVFVASARALGVVGAEGIVPTLDLLVMGNAIVLATLLPISIGGVGVREGVAVAMLSVLGVPAADAVLIGVLGYLTGQTPNLTGGLISVFPWAGQPEKLGAALVANSPSS